LKISELVLTWGNLCKNSLKPWSKLRCDCLYPMCLPYTASHRIHFPKHCVTHFFPAFMWLFLFLDNPVSKDCVTNRFVFDKFVCCLSSIVWVLAHTICIPSVLWHWGGWEAMVLMGMSFLRQKRLQAETMVTHFSMGSKSACCMNSSQNLTSGFEEFDIGFAVGLHFWLHDKWPTCHQDHTFLWAAWVLRNVGFLAGWIFEGWNPCTVQQFWRWQGSWPEETVGNRVFKNQSVWFERQYFGSHSDLIRDFSMFGITVL